MKNEKPGHLFEHDGITYLIEKDHQSIGYNSFSVVWNLDGTPRCRTGWCWSVKHNGCWVAKGDWASSLGNAKAAIQGRETGDVCFA